MVKKILFITLSNIGDVILTLPALDYLRGRFPDAEITVMVGPRPKEIFQNNPHIEKTLVFDKHSRLTDKIMLFNRLKKERFDMVVDLRNSFFGFLLPCKYKTSSLRLFPRHIKHMKDRHLYQVQKIKYKAQDFFNVRRNSLHISPQDEEYINRLLKENGISGQDKIVVISAGARSHIKRWSADKFLELVLLLTEEFGVKIVLAGDKDDLPIAEYIINSSVHFKYHGYPVADLTGKTNIGQLACLLKKTLCVVTNDSAILHIASYLNIPVVAVFGPTNELKYGPWSENSSVIKKDIFCRPCEKAQCRFTTLKCMQAIKVGDVLAQVKNILLARTGPAPGQPKPAIAGYRNDFKRILIVRTDRIGDVLLSTPVIRALRDYYPHAYIAMMVSPYAKEIVEGNPDLDEVIIYDKKQKHKKWRRSVKFALNLKKKRFDLAIILHPTNRVHLVTFFAGIPKRVGYDRKLGFLLTDRIKHIKQSGEKHELEYALDLVRYLGIEPRDKSLLMPIKAVSEAWVEELFGREGINKTDKLLAIHPGASCVSKIWPLERFAQVADKLIEKYGFKVLIIAGPKDIARAAEVSKNMRHPSVNLAAKTSVSQLASLLKRCRLFISNDSGPVHIAGAVGAPVISIFGRSQRGLSPVRWGPTGENSRIAHKTVGCIECRAHNCIRRFACLKAVSTNDVLDIADSILS